MAVDTLAAVTAPEVGGHHHSLTHVQSGHVRADLYQIADDFMAGYAHCAGRKLTVLSV